MPSSSRRQEASPADGLLRQLLVGTSRVAQASAQVPSKSSINGRLAKVAGFTVTVTGAELAAWPPQVSTARKVRVAVSGPEV